MDTAHLIDRLERRLRLLEDERAIRRLAHEYCIGADHRDPDRWTACWVPDGTWTIGDAEDHVFRGHEAILEAVQRQWAHFKVMQHATSNHTIEIDGETAIGRAEVVVMVQLDDESWVLGGGTYVDDYVRAGGSWKILHRRATRPIDIGPIPGWSQTPES